MFFVEPLRRLYFDAPSIGSIGGWGGSEDSDICAQITNVPAVHWQNDGSYQCVVLLNKRFDTYLSVIVNWGKIYIFIIALHELYLLLKMLFFFSIRKTSLFTLERMKNVFITEKVGFAGSLFEQK